MTYFSVLIDTAKYMKKNSSYKPILLFASHYPTVKNDIKICEREKIDYIFESSNLGYRIEKKSFFNKMTNLINNNFFICSLGNNIIQYKREFNLVKKIIIKTKPSIIVLAGDNVGYNTSIFIKMGHKFNISSIILPSWMAGAREAAEAYYYDGRHNCKRITNYIAGLFFPDWTYKHKGKRLIRWPAPILLTLKLFKLDPPVPWALNSGYADVIAAESKGMYKYMVEEGLTKSKIKLTGSLSNDALASCMQTSDKEKRKFFLKNGFNLKQKTILCALPPNMLYGLGRQECEFKTYRDLVEFWMRSISNLGYNVMVSLHPSTKYSDVSYLKKKYGVKIFTDPICKLIPHCDLFIASISATIQWAIACSKPVINFDVYHYRYTDYVGVSGVINVESGSDFIKELGKITKNDKYFQKLKEFQESNAQGWGMLDGKSGKRIIKIITNLTCTNKTK